MSFKRVIGFLSIVDRIPEGAEFLYSKPLVFEETEEQKAERIITGESKLQSIEQVYYEVHEEDFPSIQDRMKLTANERITQFLQQHQV